MSNIPVEFSNLSNILGKEDEAVCEICGSKQKQEVMVNCAQCNACRHRYCLEVVAFEMTGHWYCYECQKKADGHPKPIQGEQTEFQRPLHGSDLTTEGKTPTLDNNRRNVAHPSGLKTAQRYENPKVKFIPCEEAALLSKERQPAYNKPKFVLQRRHSQVHPASTRNVKQSSSMKCVSPTRHVRPASPRNVKQSSSMKCVSPSRSDTQVFALKRFAAASQNPVELDDINMRQKARSGATSPMVLPHSTKGEVKENDHQIQDELREVKVATAYKGKINSQVEDRPREIDASAPTNADIGCESGMKSHHNIDMPVIISSSAEYARRPPPEAICWTGCFLVSGKANRILGEFKAYYPSRVSSKVRDIAKKIPNNLQLKILPRLNYWPKSFEMNRPVYDDIGLLFFSSELDRCEEKHPHLLEAYCSFVMKARIDDRLLLIYSSEVLPPDSQWIDGESYLWGIFVKSRGKSNSARFGSFAA